MSSRGDGRKRIEASTLVFADLAGFTALTEAHGDDEATMIAGDFAAAVRQILADYDAEEVKTIGDEVMIRVADPDPLYGSESRSSARPGEVLLTDQTRRRLRSAEGVELQELGARYFKHVPELIPVYSVRDPGIAASELEIDPVCRMAVARERADSKRKRRGIAYYFCSADCRRQFDEEPRRYVAMSPPARAARKGFLINLSAFVVVGGVHLVAGASRDFSDPAPEMLLLFVVWAIALALHYRAVRSVI